MGFLDVHGLPPVGLPGLARDNFHLLIPGRGPFVTGGRQVRSERGSLFVRKDSGKGLADGRAGLALRFHEEAAGGFGLGQFLITIGLEDA